jgi:hypothetical protein
LGTAAVNGASGLWAERCCLIVFLLDAIRVLIGIWEIVDAAALAGAAMLLSGDEV